MATPRNVFRTPRVNQENSGIANRLLNKGGFLSERKHGSTKQAFGDVKNTFQPNKGEQNFQKQTPVKVFNKQTENVKVITPIVKQKERANSYDKCSYKEVKDNSYYWYKNCVWTDNQMDDFIKRSTAEIESDVVMTKPPPFTPVDEISDLPDCVFDFVFDLPELLPPVDWFTDSLPEVSELQKKLDEASYLEEERSLARLAKIDLSMMDDIPDPDERGINASFNLISFD